MRNGFIVFFLAFSSMVIAGNPDALRKEAVEKLSSAIKLIVAEKSENAEAEILIEEGLTILRQIDDLLNWMDWQKNLGDTWHYDLGDPIKALEVYNACLKNSWRKPKNPEEYETKAWLLANIGYAYKKAHGDLIAHRDYYLWASKIFVDTLGIEDFTVAKYIYNELGNAYSNLKDFEHAQFYLEKVRDISRDAQEWERWAIACSDLGLMYNIKKEDSIAVSTINEALQLSDNLSYYPRYILLETLGLILIDIKDFENALKYTDLANKEINSANISADERDELQYDLYINYGKIYKELKAFELSEFNYSQALKMLKATSGESDKRGLAFLHLYLGSLYSDWGKSKAALKEFNTSLTYLLPDYIASENIILPQSNELTTERLLIFIFDSMAEIFMDLHQQNKQSAYVELTQECYRLASEVEELMLQEYFMEGSSLAVLEDHREYKENALAFLYPIWNKEKTAEQSAFIFKMSERSRAILLLENYQLSKTLKEGNAGEETLLKQYEQLNDQIAELEQKIYELKKSDPESSQMESLKKELMRSKEELAKITKIVLSDSSNQVANTYGAIAGIKDVQLTLSPDQLLIEYFAGEENLFIIAITQTDFHLWRKELPEGFEATIKSFLHSITGKYDNTQKSLFSASSYQLYNWLLKDVLDWKPKTVDRLVLVPDGLLGLIPFDLLISEKPKDQFYYNALDYLIKHNSVSYAPSASLFVLQSKKEQKRAQKLFAGFAPEYRPYENKEIAARSADKITQLKDSLTRGGIYALPGAIAEVNYIADLLNGDGYLEKDASEFTFKQIAKDYQILLLSMHSLVDEDNPKFSTLLFTDSASTDEDDLLYALELSTLTLQADMAVLSACNTGFGKMHEGEGVMSFSRAFFSAGVPSTLMTLWKIPDASSSIIIKAFFKNLKDGMPKDIALQKAKLDYLLDSDLEEGQDRPVFWSGFIASGNMEPLDIETGISIFWWLGGALLLLFAFLYFKYLK